MTGKKGQNQPKPAKKPQISAKRARKPEKSTTKDAERARAYYAANQEQAKAKATARYHALSEAERAERRWRSYARPPMPRPGSKNSSDQRKVSLARAYCEWSDDEEVVRIYTACAILNELGWGDFEVDHVIPLNHALVCGLHTHTNLAVVPALHNARKGNMIWPGMPEITWDTIDLLLLSP